MTTATKKTMFQILEGLNWCSRTEFAISFLAWIVKFGMILNEPDVESQNFLVIVFWCFFWSLLVVLVPRWIRNIFKGIKWIVVQTIAKLDK